jgi:hypothetical protein
VASAAPGEHDRGLAQAAFAGDGPADLAEFAAGENLADQRQRLGFLVS